MGSNLPKKGIFALKQKNHIFACVHGHHSLYSTFPYRGGWTQWHFKVPSQSSGSDKKSKRKKDDTFLIKKTGGKIKQCYHDDMCRWKRDSFSSEVEVTREIVWIKISKNRILKKISLEMNLIGANNHINMTSDHPVSHINSFKNLLNAKS